MYFDGALKLHMGQASYAGVKPQNEDSIGIRVPEPALVSTKGIVAVIADGVSAAEAGREASDTCVTNFLSDYFSTPETWSVKKSAHQVLIALNRWLYGQGQRFLRAERGYVSTLSIAIFKSQTAHLFHVGDSRIYRWRDGDLELLTRDHSTRIDQDKAYLTRAMGLDLSLDVDYRQVELRAGDRFFLSTDGIHDFLTEGVIRSIAGTDDDDYEALCNRAIALALENGSDDNLSCQLLRVDQLPLADSQDMYQRLGQLPFPPFLDVGMILDGLRIEKELHASNRSQLYRVRDEETGAQWVMKTPSVNYEDDAAYIERFVMESWIGSRIDNPYVVKVISRQHRRTCLYYLTEWINGEAITDWVRQKPRAAISDIVDVLEQAAKGVQAMHRRETLHQDIKPDNVLVDAQDRVKIIDFGSCYVAGIAEIAVPIERDRVLGTAAYSAPEHVLDRRVGVASDVFSLAVLAFECLTGELPFSGKLEDCRSMPDYARLRYVHSYQYNPHVPHWMDAAMKKALSITPGARYQEVAEFIHDLRHPNPDFLAPQVRPLIERNPLRVWQVISFFLILINGGLLFWLLRVI